MLRSADDVTIDHFIDANLEYLCMKLTDACITEADTQVLSEYQALLVTASLPRGMQAGTVALERYVTFSSSLSTVVPSLTTPCTPLAAKGASIDG